MTGPRLTSPAHRLPTFPWDSLEGAKARASAFPDGLVDLSIGTPVDDVPASVQAALADAAAAPGYPQTAGTPGLRSAIADFMRRRHGVPDAGAVVPVVGTKEAIASLPMLLGVGEGHRVVVPELAYPTYEVAVRMAGATPVRADSLTQLGPTLPSSAPVLMFINSPGNPTGRILGEGHLRKVVQWARERGTVVVSDECYLGLAWDAEAPSILDPAVNDGDLTGLIAVHSLSKTANMASYRAGWFAGDPELLGPLLQVRRHLGLMVPGPVQAAMVAALSDDDAHDRQRSRYARRRSVLRNAVEAAGFRVDESYGGLYLWVTRGAGADAAGAAVGAGADAAGAATGAGTDAAGAATGAGTDASGLAHADVAEVAETGRDLVDWFAERGILVAPGDFYGPKGARHVRIALTASDEAIEVAAGRIRG